MEQSRDARDRSQIHADQATMAAIAAGDTRVFARLVTEMTPVLLRFTQSILVASPGEAEEVVQEALVRLWQRADDWQPNGRIATWLHRVAYRLSIDTLRKRRPSVAIEDVAETIADGGPLASARLSHADEVRAIRAAVAALPERQRSAIVLCHFQGLSQAEAAAVMGIGEHAYESLLARARRSLRATVAGRGTGR